MSKRQVETFLYLLAAISGFLVLRASSLSWPTKIVFMFFTIVFCGTFIIILEWLERRDFMKGRESLGPLSSEK
jgi:hypothetical protein